MIRHAKGHYVIRVLILLVFMTFGVLFAAASARAAEPATATRSWWMQGSVHGETTWPQPVAAGQCGWFQDDVYRYATATDRAIVDGLDDDGLLTLVNGAPEDAKVYLSHTYREVPCSTTTPTPTPSATSVPTATPTPTASVTPTPSPSVTATPAPEPSSSLRAPSETSIPAPSETSAVAPPSSTPSPPSSARGTSTPELSETGINVAAYVIAGAVAVGAGVWMLLAGRTKRVRRG